jgi:murein DD-endopeptidase MepM/ murein hydrolase activator NlpD
MIPEFGIDTLVRGEVQRAQVSRRDISRRGEPSTRLSRRNRFSLLVVRGDGARVVQLNVPKSLVVIGVACVVLGSVLVAVLTTDWAQLRRASVDVRFYRDRIARQQAALDAIDRKVRGLRQEVAGWREVHARLIDAFGPEHAPNARGQGIGGPAVPAEPTPEHLVPRDELSRLAESVTQESQSLQTLDRLLMRAAKILAMLPSRWPVRGPVNSEFGNRASPWTNEKEFHAGMDIRAERGTPVRAPAVGTVSFAGWQGEYGHTVMIDHGNDIKSVYGHLSKIGVIAGQRVNAGTELGLTGNSGRSSGPHLHYEILVKGRPVNPRAYLWD